MNVMQSYLSPRGEMLLAAEEEGLTGVWFVGQKYFARTLSPEAERGENPVLAMTRDWLDVYFSGREPDFFPPLRPAGTAFQQAVWRLLLQVPYGTTTTYGELARRLAGHSGRSVSAQAVGGAVGHNPILILIPCHRIVGARGNLTGYAAGWERKKWLLEGEGVEAGHWGIR